MIVAGLFALYLALKVAWAYFPGLWAKFVAWRNTPRAMGLAVDGPAPDEYTANLQALRRIAKRCRGNPDAIAAVKVIGAHLLEDVGE